MTDSNIAERIDPDPARTLPLGLDPVVRERQVRLHKERYDFAVRMLNDGRVLDAGCGTGYGTEALSARGLAVGVDNDRPTLALAASRYQRPLFFCADLEQPLPFVGLASVVCLEAIEHVRAPELVCAHLRTVLCVPGRLVISVPLNEQPGQNPYHLRLWDSAADFRRWVEAQGFTYIGRSFEQADNWTGVFCPGALP